MTPLERFLGALRDKGYTPRESGTRWTCRCPSHDDRSPSLSISVGDDGRVLVKCHAGCAPDAVCKAIGLHIKDLFACSPPNHNRRNNPSPLSQRCENSSRNSISRSFENVVVDETVTPRIIFPNVSEAVNKLVKKYGQYAGRWTYRNAQNKVVGLMLRWNFNGTKEFRPVSRLLDGSGWFIGGMPKGENGWPLYRLPHLLALSKGSTVFITEGEKAADAARSLGFVATTSPHGAKSADKTDWSSVAGMIVIILPDLDPAGEKYAADVVRLATKTGAQAVRIASLNKLWAEMPKGGDIADFLEHRLRDGAEADDIRAEIEILAAQALAEKSVPVDGAPITKTNEKRSSAEVLVTETRDVPSFVPFPVEVFPEPIRGFIVNAADSIGCDTSYIALPVLSALAAAIGNTHRIQLKRIWTEPAHVWTVIVGESGTHKTPAFNTAIKSVRVLQNTKLDEYQEARRTWEEDSQRYDEQLKKLNRSTRKNSAKGIYRVLIKPEKPVEPVVKRFIVSDTTTEALTPILVANPRGVLLVRDELSGWFGSFDRYAKGTKSGTDSAYWLSMHAGDDLIVDRKTGVPSTLYVPSPSLSLAGGIQPQILARAMRPEHHENGMLARLLFAMPPRKPKRWKETDADPAIEAAMMRIFRRLYSLKISDDDEGSKGYRVISLTPEAKALWTQFYNEHAKEEAKLSGGEAAAWSKLEGYTARLALVIHLAGCAAVKRYSVPSPVDAKSMKAGIKLSRWFGNETLRVYAILRETEEEREERILIEWIERRGGKVTIRELTHDHRGYRNSPAKAEQALSNLVKRGVGKWKRDPPGPKGGRPTQSFQLLSAVTITETPSESEE